MPLQATQAPIPAVELAARNKAAFPNESADYRRARNALPAEEIELRRHIEKVAQQRRELPPGGEVTKDYRFDSERGPVRFADLFTGKNTLVVYSFMYGPHRKNPCPMCTTLMDAWDGEAPAIEQRVGFAMVARSPTERIAGLKQQRGWRHLRLYSDPSGDYTRDYVSAADADIPSIHVFTRQGRTIRHFWAEETAFDMADPGQGPRGAVDPTPLWSVLDWTPEGRGADWYPKLVDRA